MILANHEMGKTMQTDKYDALFWARDQGYVDMDKVCISGASYGGYAAMHAATKMPGMFKCIIAYVGVYDLTESEDLRGSCGANGECSKSMLKKAILKILKTIKTYMTIAQTISLRILLSLF